MKKTLLLSAFAFAAIGAMAQVDVTPGRYVFADQPVGLYKMDNVGNCEGGTAANPKANWERVVTDWNDGYVVVNNGQMAAMDKPNTQWLQSGMNIVDLGGEVGKVLAMKGHGSETFEGVPAADDNLTVGWYNLSWYLKQGTCPQDKAIRFQVVFKMYENTPDITKGQLRFDAYTFANNHCSGNTDVAADKATTTKVWGSADFIARYDDDNSPMENDEGEMFFDDELWQQVEFDWTAFSEDGDADPLRLCFAYNNNLWNNSCILIKSIKAIQGPEGDPECKAVKLVADPQRVQAVIGDMNVRHSYDLAGRRAAENAKGIVIVDGKKIVK